MPGHGHGSTGLEGGQWSPLCHPPLTPDSEVGKPEAELLISMSDHDTLNHGTQNPADTGWHG